MGYFPHWLHPDMPCISHFHLLPYTRDFRILHHKGTLLYTSGRAGACSLDCNLLFPIFDSQLAKILYEWSVFQSWNAKDSYLYSIRSNQAFPVNQMQPLSTKQTSSFSGPKYIYQKWKASLEAHSPVDSINKAIKHKSNLSKPGLLHLKHKQTPKQKLLNPNIYLQSQNNPNPSRY